MFSIVLVFYFSISNFSNSDIWKQISPLKTTKKEIEKKIGKGIDMLDNTFLYKHNDNHYYITFSEGQCRERHEPKWNVEKDVVVDFIMYPKKLVPIDKMPYDLKTFDKVKGADDMSGYYKYLNGELGLILETQIINHSKEEFVTAIVATSKTSESYLRCL